MARSAKIIGVRELRTHLSAYLKRVKKGEVVTIGDRRLQPLAKLVPSTMTPEEIADEKALDKLAAMGVITRGRGFRYVPKGVKLLKKGKLASDMIIEDRR